MFTDKSQFARQEALKVIMKTRMAKGVSIREHMLKMIATFEEIKVLGAIIEPES
jgi:hypothetical protein